VGVTWPDISFLLAARELGASYERTLTIGRQSLFADASELARAHADCGVTVSVAQANAVIHEGHGYADSLLRHLGAHELDSLDASGYEGSTLVHDLNEPLPGDLRERYTLVFDGGSLEHVFNFPQALKNCMEAVAVGGHLVTITPANNLFGHGFYQFSPELFYRAFAPVNGFRVVVMLVRAVHRWAHWYAIRDPASVGDRVTMTSPWTSLLFVLAERTEHVEPLAVWPQQSDYTVAWSQAAKEARGTTLRERLPAPLRRAAHVAATLAGTTSGPGHFERVEMADIAGSRGTSKPIN
jgi:hypothetical protein